jgi:pimeloyl-ACP methyl ester carboxylesterase
MAAAPAVREMGQGDAVICLHCSASSGGQWRTLGERLARRWRVLMPDLYGYGKDAPRDRLPDLDLGDEVEWLQPVLDRAGTRFDLVGHSYGGLIALQIALRMPDRVRSVALYEPATWSVTTQVDPSHPGSQEIESVRDATIAAVAEGRLDQIAEMFVTYWAGAAAWDAMPPERRQATAQSMPKVGAEFRAERRDGHSGGRLLDRYGTIRCPVLYLMGARTKPSARRVGELLPPAFADCRVVAIEGAGHMGPVTHADAVNAQIERFLGGPVTAA